MMGADRRKTPYTNHRHTPLVKASSMPQGKIVAALGAEYLDDLRHERECGQRAGDKTDNGSDGHGDKNSLADARDAIRRATVAARARRRCIARASGARNLLTPDASSRNICASVLMVADEAAVRMCTKNSLGRKFRRKAQWQPRRKRKRRNTKRKRFLQGLHAPSRQLGCERGGSWCFGSSGEVASGKQARKGKNWVIEPSIHGTEA